MDVMNARLSRRGIYDASRGKAKIGTSPVTPTGTPIAQRAAPAGATPVMDTTLRKEKPGLGDKIIDMLNNKNLANWGSSYTP